MRNTQYKCMKYYGYEEKNISLRKTNIVHAETCQGNIRQRMMNHICHLFRNKIKKSFTL